MSLWDPRGASFIRRFNKLAFCRGAVFYDSRRPSFTDRLCNCCNVGTGRATCSGPTRPIFTRRHCEFGFCHGTVLCKSRRPSFTNSLCDCGNVGTGRITRTGPWEWEGVRVTIRSQQQLGFPKYRTILFARGILLPVRGCALRVTLCALSDLPKSTEQSSLAAEFPLCCQSCVWPCGV